MSRVRIRWLTAHAVVMGLAIGVATAGSVALIPTQVQAKPRARATKLADLVERLREAEEAVVEAERAAAKDAKKTEAQLAKRLVAGQLKLGERDYEGAAMVFLDLMENHPNSQAAPQAVYFLGEALAPIDMERWAAELFAQNLRDTRPEARRFHQRSVARLFDLAIPRRKQGFARRPGLSATPEVRARLEAVGVDTQTPPPEGVIGGGDVARLARWAESFAPSNRSADLRYSYGRWLYLTGEHAKGRAELDGISPLDIPMSRGGPDAKWRVRAAYVAASATASMKEIDEALERFALITRARPKNPRDRQIVELSWMAIGRIHHDRSEWDDAVRAYRRIGRDSPFFPEALYEIAWTLLRAGRFDQAVQALDLLLIYDPDSPIVAEIKQLRGKVQVRQRNYKAAEEEFLTLRREFDRLTKALRRKLQSKGDASTYFAAVVAEDMEHFSLGSLLPVAALPVARGLHRAVHAEELARDVGYLERELTEVRALLARMEEAVQASDKARLFNDLAAHVAALETVTDDLIRVQENLVHRLANKKQPSGYQALESTRMGLRARVDRPLGKGTDKRNAVVKRIQGMQEQAHKLALTVKQQRAQLVATERYYEATRKDQKIDHQGFLTQAAQMRDTIAASERAVAAAREKIDQAQSALRYHDPLRAARAQVVAKYRAHLSTMYGKLRGADPEVDSLWRRAEALATRSTKARGALDQTAGARLRDAIAILVEERANLDQYRVELLGTKDTTKGVVAEVMEAAYTDVVNELGNLVLRSEVGLLDVSWAMKEDETEAVERLEKERDRDLAELDEALDMGLEDLGR